MLPYLKILRPDSPSPPYQVRGRLFVPLPSRERGKSKGDIIGISIITEEDYSIKEKSKKENRILSDQRLLYRHALG
jgi:hypothetical protein